MPVFKLPLSGDVVQSINPFTAFMTGGQLGLVKSTASRAIPRSRLTCSPTSPPTASSLAELAMPSPCRSPISIRGAAQRAGEGGDRRAQGDARQDRGREGKAQAGRGSPGCGFIGSLAARASARALSRRGTAWTIPCRAGHVGARPIAFDANPTKYRCVSFRRSAVVDV